MSLRGAILQIKRKKAPFFIKKNDYKGMKIEINCTGSDTIQLHELTEFQGELKERSPGDLFGGSGTTIIACEKLNRTAYVMELDPHYCDVIRKRWTKWAEENGVNAGSGALR